MFSPSKLLLCIPSKLLQRKTYKADDSNTGTYPTDCYACTQVGVPAFHSTSCDQFHAPLFDACAGSSLLPIRPNNAGRARPGIFGDVLDPRSPRIQRWNRAFLLARGLALAVDPLFFYALSVKKEASQCLQLNRAMVAAVTAIRTTVDAVHVFHLWLQFKMAYVSPESLVVGCGKLVWDGRAVALHYVKSLKGFWFDIFVILPIPQVVFWLIVPKLINEGETKMVGTILVATILFQFLPKVYHSVCLMRKMKKVTGYIFGTIWWGFGLNLIAYFIASHFAGGCWYVLAIQRVASCFRQTACKTSSFCLDYRGPYNFGIYQWAVPVVSSNSMAIKILYPILWGLMTLSTFGNILSPTSNALEVIFSILMVLSGLLLFTLLIGNIQVFLHAVMAKRKKMQLRSQDMEWWMRRRQLPSYLRKRVRRFERQKWAALEGDDEMELVENMPEGLRRDIKRHLCLNLIKKVPLFHCMDDLTLDNICDRVKPVVLSQGEKVVREGDPVQRMVFVVRGKIRRTQSLSKGKVARSVLEGGAFLGDELLAWCLRRPFNQRLPATSATFTCVESTEAFSIEANDLRYITEHFRYKFANEKIKRTARYYSSNWRTWAAVNIQLAWRRHRTTRGNEEIPQRLIHCAAMFLSIKPHDHLE